MDDGDVVLETFESEIVSESEEDDTGDLSHPLLHLGQGERRKLRSGDTEQVRRRNVYSKYQTKSSSRSCCSLLTWKSILCFLLCLILLGILAFFLTQKEALLEDKNGHLPNMDYMDFKNPDNMVTYDEILEDNFSFNVSRKTDVMVFLHIQKTGGTTFGKHLVEDIDLTKPCDCHRKTRRRKFHCDCFRPGTKDSNWLFSRYSTGWKCGLHPDWTELTGCVDHYMRSTEPGPVSENRRYFYISFLRDPVSRYLSEWRHVARGATWDGAELKCGGVEWGEVLPRCWGQEEDWTGVELQEFVDCPDNLAPNRQTRMLANLELVNCYNTTAMDPDKRDRLMLNSAKANLANLAFFGLTEEQEMSQYIFEETFNLRFKLDFDQLNRNETHSGHSEKKLDDAVMERIRNLNSLDIELYKFASDLLKMRFEHLKASDDSFKEHIEEVQKEEEFSWNDIEEEEYR